MRFAGRVGLADLRRHARALEACGVDARLAGDVRTPTGSIVVLAHDRSMFTDRGANLALGRDDLPDELLDGVEHVHVSGYALVEEGPRTAVLELVARAGVPWSVDPASSAFVADTPFLEWTAGASLCFPNEDEAQVLGDGMADAYEVVVLKRGREGVRVVRRGAEPVDVPASTAVAVDQTGVGDAFAAGYLAAHAQGADDRACAAGGGSRGRRGGQPPRRAAALTGSCPRRRAAVAVRARGRETAHRGTKRAWSLRGVPCGLLGPGALVQLEHAQGDQRSLAAAPPRSASPR